MSNSHPSQASSNSQLTHQSAGAVASTPALPRLAYTMRETADIIGVSYITVHRLLKRGKLRASDALRNKVIPRTEIERFLKESIASS